MFNSASLNEITLVGRIGRDCELKTSASGVNYARLALATSELRKDGESWKTVTTWHDLTIFGERAVKMSPKLVKGSMVIVKGYLSYREIQTADNHKLRAGEVKVEEVLILSSPKLATTQQTSAAAHAAAAAQAPASASDLIC